MSDHDASLDGLEPRTRYRPSRSKSAEDSPRSAPSSCVESDRGSSRKAKTARRTLKKNQKSDPLEEAMQLPPQSDDHEAHWEDDVSGYTPSLGQIPEATESRTANRRSSAASSVVEQRRRRRRTDESSLSRSRPRHKHGSLQRRAESLTQASNPSLVSLLSGITQSSTSSGSNTTITERSYRSRSDSSRRKRYETEDQHQETASDITSTTDMGSARSDVFQYLSEDVAEPYTADDAHSILPQASSTSSSGSSEDSQTGHGATSSVGEHDEANDTPRSSPTLARKASSDDSHYQPRYRVKSRKPLYQSSFVHGPGDDEGEEPEHSDETASDAGSISAVDSGHAPHSTLKPASPPRYPSSTSSQHSDPHTRRLRQQEREHANHVFRAPQPQRDFHFDVAPSPSVQSSVPYYDPRMYSGASPTEFSATASQASGWPHQPNFPPQLAIGYSPQSVAAYPLSPQAAQAMPMTLHSPTGAQSSTGQPASPPFQHAHGQLSHYQPPAAGAEVTRSTVSGYELLAHKLSESSRGGANSPGTVVPVYRKFEQLNHRVLLHLQDEICELEEELRYLDRCIAQMSPRDETGHVQPASRRGDARYGNELHRRRTELLGRVFQKLEQYNQALSSFSNLIRDLDPASPTTIKAYRAWMAKRAPIDSAESQFLERKNDLLAVPRRSSAKTVRGGAEQDESVAVWFPLMLVVPLMAFAMVPTFFGRLFVVLAMGAAEVRMVTTTPELRSFMTVQEWTKAGLV